MNASVRGQTTESNKKQMVSDSLLCGGETSLLHCDETNNYISHTAFCVHKNHDTLLQLHYKVSAVCLECTPQNAHVIVSVHMQCEFTKPQIILEWKKKKLQENFGGKTLWSLQNYNNTS